MRILIVTNYFESHRGGVEIVAGVLARELATRGFRIAWAATGDDARPPKEAPNVRRAVLPAWNIAEASFGFPFPLLGPRGLTRLVREVGAADALMLHDSLCMGSVGAFVAAKWAGKPVVLVQHIGRVPYRRAGLRMLMRIGDTVVAGTLLRAADQVVFISQTTRDFYAHLRFRRPSRLILNGVDTAVFHPPADATARADSRTGLGLARDRTLALFVGRFVEKKGVELLRQAAALRPDVDWVFAGWGPLDPRGWGLANVRVFDGLSGSALADLYRAADVLVLPSQGEGFPLVVQEALACGLPVVCGVETLSADPEAAAWLVGVDPAAPDAAEAVARAVDAATAGGRDSGARAAFARSRYAWGASADRHAEILRALARPVAQDRAAATESPSIEEPTP